MAQDSAAVGDADKSECVEAAVNVMQDGGQSEGVSSAPAEKVEAHNEDEKEKEGQEEDESALPQMWKAREYNSKDEQTAEAEDTAGMEQEAKGAEVDGGEEEVGGEGEAGTKEVTEEHERHEDGEEEAQEEQDLGALRGKRKSGSAFVGETVHPDTPVNKQGRMKLVASPLRKATYNEMYKELVEAVDDDDECDGHDVNSDTQASSADELRDHEDTDRDEFCQKPRCTNIGQEESPPLAGYINVLEDSDDDGEH